VAIFMIGLSFNSSLLLFALYSQKILGYDAWTAGLAIAPGGFGTMLALMISGRLVSRMDQRVMLVAGCLMQAASLWLMTRLTLTMDFWSVAWPRFLQGFSMGFVFVPLQALALATIPTVRLANATAAYNVVRNLGGSVGIALSTTLLARRSQEHQAILTGNVHVWSPVVVAKLQKLTDYFMAQGADAYTAGQRALLTVYRETLVQAQILSYADAFWLLVVANAAVMVLIPVMRRIRSDATRRREGAEPEARDPGLPAPAD
jgi:DHA2 family multidrug resistance protein